MSEGFENEVNKNDDTPEYTRRFDDNKSNNFQSSLQNKNLIIYSKNILKVSLLSMTEHNFVVNESISEDQQRLYDNFLVSDYSSLNELEIDLE